MREFKPLLDPYDGVRVERDTTHDEQRHATHALVCLKPEHNDDGSINEFHHFMHQITENLCVAHLTPRKFAQIMLNISLYRATKPQFEGNPEYEAVIAACDALLEVITYVADDVGLFAVLEPPDRAAINALLS